MKIYLDQATRDNFFNQLTEEQKSYLKEHVKRGKKTEFANYMAKQKGMVIPHSATDAEVELLLDEWILIDFIDNGHVSEETPCECGRPLRYQYIVKHRRTGEMRRFGITHFEEHTGLPANIVKGIKEGFEKVDYELDELLFKLMNGWDINNEIPFLPEGFELPEDIQEHLLLKLPLLDNQITKLKELINHSMDRPFVQPVVNRIAHIETNTPNDSSQLDLFSEVLDDVKSYTNDFQVSDDLQAYIIGYLNKGAESARIICELLIKRHGLPNERYNSGKPKIYFTVCQFIDSLCQNQFITLKSCNHEDRIYQRVGKDIDLRSVLLGNE